MPTINEQFYAQMQIAVEPRLIALLVSGTIFKITEAVDDKRPTPAEIAGPVPANGMTQRLSGYLGFATSPVVHAPGVVEPPGRARDDDQARSRG